MCFKYKEKRYGKTALRLFGLLFIVLGAGFGFGGVCAFIYSPIKALGVVGLVAGIALGLVALGFGVTIMILSMSMINSWKSGRDGNKSIGLSNARLCEKCGRVVSKGAEYCEHCGEKLHEGLGLKTCPKCKAKNSAKAEFCEKCGTKFED